jgi:Protein of unknown function (DUF3179)
MDGADLSFDILGLYNGSMLMKDREEGNLWSCYNGVGLYGRVAGKALPRNPAYLCQLSEWLAEHPDSEILQWVPIPTHTDGRHGHGCWFHFGGRGPHPHALDTMLTGEFDPRLPENTLVVGVCDPGGVTAFPLPELHRAGCVVNETLGGTPIVAWAHSPDSTWMGVFRRRLEGEDLEFEWVGKGRFRDRQSGSLWTIEGRAVDGRHAGSSLEPLDFVSVRWSAWSGFYPQTEVYRCQGPSRLRVDAQELSPLFRRLEEAGFPVEVVGERLLSSLPPAACRGLDVKIAGDPFLALLFEGSGQARDYVESSRVLPKDLFISFFRGEETSDLPRHAIAGGSFVLESNPEQFSDPESLQPLPEEEIAWSRLLQDARFAVTAETTSDGARPPFQELFQTLSQAGYPVAKVKPMLRQWLRPQSVAGYAAEIAGDRFLIYQFANPEQATDYAAERHHTVQAGRFVLRSDPLDQYHVYTEQTVERPVRDVAWSELLNAPAFLAALGRLYP